MTFLPFSQKIRIFADPTQISVSRDFLDENIFFMCFDKIRITKWFIKSCLKGVLIVSCGFVEDVQNIPEGPQKISLLDMCFLAVSFDGEVVFFSKSKV